MHFLHRQLDHLTVSRGRIVRPNIHKLTALVEEVTSPVGGLSRIKNGWVSAISQTKDRFSDYAPLFRIEV